MTPEEKILTYSILSLLGLLVPDIRFVPVMNIHGHNFGTIIKSLGLIVSFVFYCLSISEIKKIKKNIYYKLSIAFLSVTSIIYVIGILLSFLSIFYREIFVKKYQWIEMQEFKRKKDVTSNPSTM